MHINDILEHAKSQMKEDKENIKEWDDFPTMKSYYQGRYDAYYAIIDALKDEVKRLNLTI